MPPKSSTLLQIYNKITEEKSYCFVCFRTNSESKLKTPLPSLKTTTSLSKLQNINNEPPQICYMCETLAVAAAKFRKAVFFATSIDMLFKAMRKSEAYKNKVQKLLSSKEPVASSEMDRVRTMQIDQDQLERFRRSRQLQRSQITLIDTSRGLYTMKNVDSTATTGSDTLDLTGADTTEVCDLNNGMVVHTNCGASEDIIVVEDEEPPIKLKTVDKPPKEIPIAPRKRCHSPKKKQSTAIGEDIGTKTIWVREDIVMEPSSVREVNGRTTTQLREDTAIKTTPPRENTEINTNQNTQTPTLQKTLSKPDTLGYLHPIYKGTDGSCIVPSLTAQIVDGRLMLVQTQETSVLTQFPLPKPLLIDNNTIIVPTPAIKDDVDIMVDNTLMEKIKEMKAKRLPTVVVDPENKVVREPVMQTDRIDWEDKIPMDVISFVDATDPNPPSFIKPLLVGQDPIVDVRSLNREFNSKHAKLDVIDLC